MICQMDISNIKAELDKNIGQKVMIRGAMGRKKFFEEKAIIENTYPDIFRVKSEEKELSFEEKIKRLEAIVSELETGDVALDEAIDKYTEAMKLSKECSEKLNQVTEKVNKILTENGTLEDFEVKE